MSILRRYHREGNFYFITNVTFGRSPILTKNVRLLTNAIMSARVKTPFELLAWVIIPDHFHFVIGPSSWDISKLLQTIKMSFGASYRKQVGISSGRVWQNRFWDHIIRDQEDLNRHLDYVHYNPVKHGLAQSAFDWKWSSIHDYRREGCYPDDWGRRELHWGETDFGE
jgi:putative transposase